MTEYKTISQNACAEFTERRSRFIGYARPVSTEEDAISFLNEIRQKHWDASHNVYAYSLRGGQLRRYSDDGEPQGTAGMPVLEVLQKPGIVDAAIVVTRYFGGVLLGAGGLVRAYSHAASLGIQAAKPIVMRLCWLLELSCDYSQYGILAALIPECGGVVNDSDFTEIVTLRFHMAQDDVPLFRKRLADATGGTVEAEQAGEKYFEWKQEF